MPCIRIRRCILSYSLLTGACAEDPIRKHDLATSEPQNANSDTFAVTAAPGGRDDTTSSAGSAGTPSGTDSGGGDSVERRCPPFPQFPNRDCTGVPKGYALTTIDGDYTTTSDAQRVDGLFIAGDLNVAHDGVTVTNTRIAGRVQSRGRTKLTLQDVELGADECPAGSNGGMRLITSCAGYTLIRAHLHHNADDMLAICGGDPVLIRDTLIEDPCFYDGDHLDAVQFYDPGGVGDITIAHSNIDVRPANSSDLGNAAVFWADTPGAGSTLTIYETLLAGGNFSLSPYDSGAGSGIVIDVHDTVFAHGSQAGSACFVGQANDANHSPTIPYDGTEGLKWDNNSWDDGTPLQSCQ